DELSPDAEARGALLVFVQERAPVEAPSHVLRVELPQLDGDGLKQRGEADGLVDAHRHVAHTELESREERVGTHVPPDLLRIVDAVGLHQRADVLVELAGAAEVVGYARAGEAL